MPLISRRSLAALAWITCTSLGFAASPQISFARITPGEILLSWPESGAADATLEQSSALGPAASWSAVPNPPTSANGLRSVTLPTDAKTRFYRLRSNALVLAGITETSPTDGARGVAVTRETVFRFDAPLTPIVPLGSEALSAIFAGRRLLTRAELSSDQQTATLFFLENLPGAGRIKVSLNGDYLQDSFGLALDADGDGLPGGIRTLEFDTFGSSALPGTAVVGHVFASEKNPDGSNRPLANVTVTVDGAEESLRTTTDASGAFQLTPSPAGRFFVHVDGRTAVGSQWPGGAYYPVVGKAWEAVAGRTNNLAGGSGEIFLPLIQSDALTAVSATESTRVTFAPSVLATQPALAGVQIDVPANSLFADNGARGGKVGIAPVAADRLPEPLPPGLNLPLVITIQTDGGLNFDTPVPVRFPNLPDPVTGVKLAAGAKTALWSFNHDTGRWEIQGSMTISADGNFAVSDTGVGVRQPGWHGVSPGTSGGGPRRRRPDPGGNPPPKDPPEECDDPCKTLASNYVACWDGYYERYLKATPPTDPQERRAWDEDKALKLGECDDKLKELMECREGAGGPCGAPPGGALASTPTLSGHRQLAGQAPAIDPGTVFATASSLTELEESYEDSRIPWPGAGDWFVVVSLETGVQQRGRLNAQGRFDDLILLPNHFYLVGYLDPARRRFGLGFFRSAGNGQVTMIPSARLLADSATGFADTDGDGLADLAENIVGTDTTLKDTDADGTPDGTEVRTGSNPLDGVILQPGVRAVAPTTANAFALAVENGTAAVLEDNRTVSLFDVRDPSRPIALARVSVPGVPVALALEWPLLAIAQAGGSAAEFRAVTLVDISNPAAPVVRWSRSIDSAEIVGIALGYGRIYASPGTGGLTVLDQSDGSILGSVQIPGHELRIVGDRLYALARSAFLSSRLTCARLSSAEALPTELGSVAVPGGPESNTTGTRLFAQADEVFVGTGDGYRVVDVRDPQTPVLLPGASSVPGRIHDFAKDSSPLLLALTSFNGPTTLQVMFFDTTDLSVNTNRFLILQTPGDPSGIRLYAGHAYIADFQGGLAVLDYRLPDTGTNAPTIELRTYPTQSSPAQHQGGTALHLSARAQDDVVVRDVEFHIDGQRHVTVGSHPFETDVPTPIWRPFKTEFVVRARATDTAGNATWSAPVTMKLIPDETPPHVVNTQPPAGFVQLEGTSTIWSATFSEPMNPGTLNSGSVLILAPGPDGVSATADDQPVANVGVTVATNATSISLQLPGSLVAGMHRVVIRATAADSNNLPMGTDYVWPFEVRKPIFWNASAAGNWSAIANWDQGRIPGTNDFVIIDRPQGEFLVTLDLDNGANPSAVNVQALVVHEPFRFQGTPNQSQFLSVVQGAQFFAPVTFASSVFLNGGPWRFTGGLEILPQRIVEIGNQPDTYGLPDLVSIGYAGAKSLINDGLLRPIGGALLHNVAGSTLELRSTGDGTGYAFIDAANQFTGPSTRFVNEGLITKTGPGTFSIGVPNFQNLGEIDVQTGKLVLVSPFGQSGTIAQDGVLRVAAGATAEFQQFASSVFTLGRLARLEGEGLIQFSAGIEVLGPYEFPGESRFLQTAKFADRVRTSGSWMSRQAVEFAGLAVELTGPVEFNGGNVKFNQATEAVLPDVRITRDTTFAGTRGATFGKPLTLDLAKLTLQTPVRFAAPVLIKNDLSAFDANGSVEFASTAPTIWDGGNLNLTGGSSRILPGANFEARSGGTLSAKGFRNEGTFRKTTDSTITLALIRPPAGVASFLNTGLFEVTGGSLVANTEPGTFVNTGTARFAGGQLVLRLEYLQTQGETVLAGGILATRGQVGIDGGAFRGAGTVVCANVALGNTATLDPGAPIGVLSITNTLGDQILGAGSLGFNRTSRLVMDLGGRTPGLEYDQVQATGDLNLNGTLEVRLANGFPPALGDEFTLITAKTRRAPKFATETLPTLGAGKKFEVVYEATAVKLRVVAAP